MHESVDRQLERPGDKLELRDDVVADDLWIELRAVGGPALSESEVWIIRW